MFCQKCGSILLVKEINKKRVLVCSGCGAKSAEADFVLSEEVKKPETKLEVIESEPEDTLPLTEVECPKCGHLKAHWWMLQTRASDEAETRFFRCQKCKHTWREYQ